MVSIDQYLREVIPQPPLSAFKQPRNLRDIQTVDDNSDEILRPESKSVDVLKFMMKNRDGQSGIKSLVKFKKPRPRKNQQFAHPYAANPPTVSSKSKSKTKHQDIRELLMMNNRDNRRLKLAESDRTRETL